MKKAVVRSQFIKFFSSSWKISILLAVFSACSSQPSKKYSPDKTRGHWTGRLTMANADKENSVDFDIVGVKGRAMRIDLSAMLGTHVGSMVLTSKKVRVLLSREKKFYHGRPVASAFRPFTGMSVDPSLVDAVLFDQPPAGWDCQLDEEGRAEQCLRGTTKVEWGDRVGEVKTVNITDKDVRLTFAFEDFDGDFKIKKRHFKLTPPKGYRVYKLK